MIAMAMEFSTARWTVSADRPEVAGSEPLWSTPAFARIKRDGTRRGWSRLGMQMRSTPLAFHGRLIFGRIKARHPPLQARRAPSGSPSLAALTLLPNSVGFSRSLLSKTRRKQIVVHVGA
jgi:hypothetical protein